jgi:hypothetical protein
MVTPLIGGPWGNLLFKLSNQQSAGFYFSSSFFYKWSPCAVSQHLGFATIEQFL